MNRRLIWNGVQLDLSDETKIGTTHQINNVGELQNRQGVFSNIFKVRKTFINRQQLEHINNVNSGSTLPYRKSVVDYYEEDVPIVQDGNGYVEDFPDKEFFYLRITSGNVTFFDNTSMLGTVGRLYDVSRDDLLAYQTDLSLAFRGLFVQWHYDDVLAVRDGSQFYIFPVVDFAPLGSARMLIDQDLRIDRTLLCLFVKDIWERQAIVSEYTLTGDFIESEVYPNLIISPDNVEYSDELILGTENPIPKKNPAAQYDFYVEVDFEDLVDDDIYQAQGGIGSGEVFSTDYNGSVTFFGKFVIDPAFEPAGSYEDSIGFKGSLTWELSGDFVMTKDNPLIVWTTVPITGFEVFLYNVTTGDLLYQDALFEDNDFEDRPFETLINIDGVFYPDHEYQFVYRVRHQERGQDGYTLFVEFANRLIETSFDNEQTYGGVMFFNQLFNIKVKDVFKDVMNQFGVICQTNNFKREISFNFFDTILKNIHLAENWSDPKQIDIRSIQIYFTIGNYTNRNLFKYKENEFVTAGYGDGTLLIDIADIEVESTQIELATSATESYTAEYEDINVPEIKMYQPDWTPNDVNNRILILDKQDVAYNLNLTDGNYASIQTENIPFARFTDPAKSPNLDFNSLIESNYKLIQGVLAKPKKVVLLKKFTAMQIKNLNFLIPVYLDVQDNDIHVQGMFYKNKIDSYKGGLTRVELVRL